MGSEQAIEPAHPGAYARPHRGESPILANCVRKSLPGTHLRPPVTNRLRAGGKRRPIAGNPLRRRWPRIPTPVGSPSAARRVGPYAAALRLHLPDTPRRWRWRCHWGRWCANRSSPPRQQSTWNGRPRPGCLRDRWPRLPESVASHPMVVVLTVALSWLRRTCAHAVQTACRRPALLGSCVITRPIMGRWLMRLASGTWSAATAVRPVGAVRACRRRCIAA
jgi:hypothetical protein